MDVIPRHTPYECKQMEALPLHPHGLSWTANTQGHVLRCSKWRLQPSRGLIDFASGELTSLLRCRSAC